MNHDYDEPPRDGLCKGHDVNKWFPLIVAELTKDEIRKAQADAQEAKSICFKCELKEPCLEYSLKHEPLGIWGGKTEAERAFIRAERRILLSREARIYLPGIGRRNANGFAYRGSKWLRDSQLMDEAQAQ